MYGETKETHFFYLCTDKGKKHSNHKGKVESSTYTKSNIKEDWKVTKRLLHLT